MPLACISLIGRLPFPAWRCRDEISRFPRALLALHNPDDRTLLRCCVVAAGTCPMWKRVARDLGGRFLPAARVDRARLCVERVVWL